MPIGRPKSCNLHASHIHPFGAEWPNLPHHFVDQSLAKLQYTYLRNICELVWWLQFSFPPYRESHRATWVTCPGCVYESVSATPDAFQD